MPNPTHTRTSNSAKNTSNTSNTPERPQQVRPKPPDGCGCARCPISRHGDGGELFNRVPGHGAGTEYRLEIIAQKDGQSDSRSYGIVHLAGGGHHARGARGGRGRRRARRRRSDAGGDFIGGFDRRGDATAPWI